MGIKNLVDQDSIRIQLKEVIIKNPETGVKLAADIGIATPTLMKFLSNGTINLGSITKIIQWIESKNQ